MAPQHAPNHPFAELHTHAHSTPSLSQLPTILASSLQVLPTLAPSSLPPPFSCNPTTVASSVLTSTTTPLLLLLSSPPTSFPYLAFLTSFSLTITVVLVSAWWMFHYPHNWPRAFAPAFVQAHRERVRGFLEKREKEEEEDDMESGVGGCGLQRERRGVVRGLIWGHTVWRRPAIWDVEGGWRAEV